jgi:hypothetical protein
MLRYPWSSSVHFREESNASLLFVAGLGALFFVLEYCGNELMAAASTLAKVVGFFVAYPLAVLVPIAVGWWLIRHDPPHDRRRW